MESHCSHVSMFILYVIHIKTYVYMMTNICVLQPNLQLSHMQ